MNNYTTWRDQALSNTQLSEADCLKILSGDDIDLLPLLQSAFEVRQKTFQRDVSIHIINNAKNGHCPEDCSYCVQSKPSSAPIEDYPIKTKDEIMAEAKQAFESGAHRYCMVFAGRGPSKKRVEKLCGMIEDIKKAYPIQVCLSPGLIDQDDAQNLKDAGLDRLNHNLNTSKQHYEKICTTHTYEDRLNTLYSAHKVGLDTCSGFIIGMGESHADILEVALKLRELKTPSIPVNFYIPIHGAPLAEHINPMEELTPEYCLRVLSMIRFLNPTAEIRVAAGREIHLRSLQPLAFYPANSLFMDGYLNTKGSNDAQTFQMLKDANFTIKTDFNLDALLNRAKLKQDTNLPTSPDPILKDWEALHPSAS